MAFELFRVVDRGFPGNERWPGTDHAGAVEPESGEVLLGTVPATWSLGVIDRKDRLVRCGLPRDEWRLDATVTDRRIVLVNRRFDPKVKHLYGIEPLAVAVGREVTARLGKAAVGQVRWSWLREVRVETTHRRGLVIGFAWGRDPFDGRGPTHLMGIVAPAAAALVHQLADSAIRGAVDVPGPRRDELLVELARQPGRFDLGPGRRPPKG